MKDTRPRVDAEFMKELNMLKLKRLINGQKVTTQRLTKEMLKCKYFEKVKEELEKTK